MTDTRIPITSAVRAWRGRPFGCASGMLPDGLVALMDHAEQSRRKLKLAAAAIDTDAGRTTRLVRFRRAEHAAPSTGLAARRERLRKAETALPVAGTLPRQQDRMARLRRAERSLQDGLKWTLQ